MKGRDPFWLLSTGDQQDIALKKMTAKAGAFLSVNCFCERDGRGVPIHGLVFRRGPTKIGGFPFDFSLNPPQKGYPQKKDTHIIAKLN